MKVWKTVLATLAASGLAIGLAAAGVIYSGAYNVAATAEHWPITRWVLAEAVHQSVERRAADIRAPESGGQSQLLVGAANFDAMCSGCHEPPGANPSVAAQGMYPRPPSLAEAGEHMSASEIYWILKHGIKASGMPAWGGTHSDDDLWAMTAFVKQLPDMSKTDYDQMVASAGASGIGHHAGGHEHGHDDSPDDGHGDEHADDPGEADHHEPAGGNEAHQDGHDQPHAHDDAHAHG